MGELNLLEHPISFSFPQRLAPSAWLGHVPFAMFAIDMLRPRSLVELGAHYGVSYCAFCQGVKDLSLDTRCYAVDTWQGDPHGGLSGPHILEDLRHYHDPLYGGFSRLIQSTFDEAVAYFEDRSIDLLHIDGYHTFDAVRHDFETWLPKLSDRGVVLFHDINVRERDFGVWKYWIELKKQYPSFEFLHSHGLGLLAVGPKQPQLLLEFMATQGQQLTRIRESFSQLGVRLEMIQDLRAQQQDFQESSAISATEIQTKVHVIEDQHQQLLTKDQQLAELVERQRLNDAALDDLRQQLVNKDASILELEQQLLTRGQEFNEQSQQLQANQAAAETQSQQLQENHQQLLERDQQLQEKDKQLQEKDQQLLERDQQLQEKDQQLLERNQQLQEKDQELLDKNEQLAARDESLSEKNRQLATQEQHSQAEQQRLLSLSDKVRRKETLLEEQQRQLLAARATAETQDLRHEKQAKQLDELRSQGLAQEKSIGGMREDANLLNLALTTVTQQLHTAEEQLKETGQNFQTCQLQLQDSQDQLQITRVLLTERDQLLQERDRLLEAKERLLLERQAQVQELLTSRALRIGSTLTWPARKLRYSRFNILYPPHTKQNGASSAALPAGPTERSQVTSTPRNVLLGIVTYNNTPQQLAQLARSIEIASERLDPTVGLQIFLIDNGDECLWPESNVSTTRFTSRGNIGFARAMNLLMAEFFANPQGEAFLCVNPDGVLHRNALAELLSSHKAHTRSLIEARQFPEEHCKSYDPQTHDTPWASGACLLIPRNIYEVTGGFDPNFFMFLEDIDLSWRARSAGFQTKISPNALFGHDVLQREHSPQTEKYFFLSGRYLAFKWNNAKFLRWAEEELVNRGHFASIVDLPALPNLDFSIAQQSAEIPDFDHFFHFSAARW